MRRRTLWLRTRRTVRRWTKFLVYRVLHADDTPHRIALGVAVGVFVTLTPTIGFQMVLILVLCALLRANKLVGLPLVWLSNPATIIPIYYPSYMLGVKLLPDFQAKTLGQWKRMVREVFERDLSWWDRVSGFWSFMRDIAVPLWVGSILVALVLGVLAYVITYKAVSRYRGRRTRRRAAFPVEPRPQQDRPVKEHP